MDFSLNAFICEICQAELIDNENADNVRGSKDRMQRFNHQMRFIRQGLQKIDSMVLPAFDITAWVKNTAKDLDSAQDSGPGLKIAGSGPSTQDSGVGIMLSMDKDEATKKLERDAEAEAKRQQNALPAWHLKSTISGDLTALGVRENARAEQVASTSSNDDILRGLGVVGGNKRAPLLAMEPRDLNTIFLVYEQYYASLAASTAASTANTPSGLGASSSDDFGGEDEEDKKPSIEYLNSLNDYRKRSRSAEDIGGGKGKVAKIEENCYNLSLTNGHHLDGVVGKPPDQVPSSNDNDPMIMVDGKKMRFSEVTEEHHDLMTPDEYTAYFDVLQAQSM
jgi:transcription initiation factor TFIIE subunit alpha